MTNIMKLRILIVVAVAGTVLLTIVSPQPWCPIAIRMLFGIAAMGLPVLGVIAIVILWRHYRWVSFIPLGIFFAGLFLADKYMPSGAILALPSSATEIKEYYRGGGNGDFVRLVKARLPEGDFPRFASNLRLAAKYDGSRYGGKPNEVNMNVSGPPWWNPPKYLESCYYTFTPKNDFLAVATYQDGWVYFCAVSW